MLVNIIAKELGLAPVGVKNVVELLEEGATVPFIARYRKEATGSMDEVAIGNIKELNEKLKALQQRKATVIATIEEQGKLTPELKNASMIVTIRLSSKTYTFPSAPSAVPVPPLPASAGWSHWLFIYGSNRGAMSRGKHVLLWVTMSRVSTMP